jgi:hypothetical protein
MTKHTKTPWAIHRYDRPSGGIAISGPDTDKINAFVATAFADLRSIEEAEANAAFIVRAVNCHAELVEALEALCEKCAETLPVEASIGYAAIRKSRGN